MNNELDTEKQELSDKIISNQQRLIKVVKEVLSKQDALDKAVNKISTEQESFKQRADKVIETKVSKTVMKVMSNFF